MEEECSHACKELKKASDEKFRKFEAQGRWANWGSVTSLFKTQK